MASASESEAGPTATFRRQPSPEREFERLYRESYELVYNYVRCRMGDDAAAEDVVAEAYLKAARSFGKFDPARARFSTWVISIASNCMRDHWRRNRPTSCIDDVPENRLACPNGTGEVADRDLADRLLGVLDPAERELVVMKYREGYRNVDIAADLGMNASTVATKLANALAKMREARGI
ncbi:MAG: sigma-70 family RNA polymerase sigma factor [Eggerthellaceae bacterium]|nr:sigma-70 family RNA polymerase sigma factor [Eggerthellaceae bacterium]